MRQSVKSIYFTRSANSYNTDLIITDQLQVYSKFKEFAQTHYENNTKQSITIILDSGVYREGGYHLGHGPQ